MSVGSTHWRASRAERERQGKMDRSQTAWEMKERQQHVYGSPGCFQQIKDKQNINQWQLGTQNSLCTPGTGILKDGHVSIAVLPCTEMPCCLVMLLCCWCQHHFSSFEVLGVNTRWDFSTYLTMCCEVGWPLTAKCWQGPVNTRNDSKIYWWGKADKEQSST